MSSSGFELQEHTADVALFVWGPDPESLFRAAADGFYAAIGDLKPALHQSDSAYGLTLTAPDLADLLGDFLAELLFLFDSRHARLVDLDFQQLSDSYIQATGRAQPLDIEHSQIDAGVKAVTRHNLEISRQPGRLETTIILDL